MGGFVAVGLVGVLYAVAAGRLERWSIGGPLVFTLAGIALGPAGFGAIDTPATNEVVELVTELTLALLLFADASTLGLVQLRRHAGIPARLLLIGLPLTIVLGGGLAYLTLPGITLALAFLVATILAPTDAALSLAVVSDPRVPMTVRNSLNVESGLNDGIATPIVTVLIAVVAAEEGATQGWLSYAVKTIAIALAVAVVLGGGAGWLVLRAREAGWTSPISEQFIVLTVALLSYLGTVSLGGNGFVASFVGGRSSAWCRVASCPWRRSTPRPPASSSPTPCGHCSAGSSPGPCSSTAGTPPPWCTPCCRSPSYEPCPWRCRSSAPGSTAPPCCSSAGSDHAVSPRSCS